MECISRDSNKVMLLSLSETLFETLKALPESTGKLLFNASTKKLIIEVPGENETSPLKYFSTIESADDDLCIFSVDGNRKANIKAKVVFRGKMTPEQPSIFRKDVQEKINKASEFALSTIDGKTDNKNQKRVLKLHEDHKSFVMANSDQAVLATLRKKYKEKRVRGDPEKVRNMLFELFANQRYWKTKALADETSQPESFLNEILQELGDKVPSGQYRGHWQLKPQYRDSDDIDEPELVKKQKLT